MPIRVASGEICTNRDVFRRELPGCSPRESRPKGLKGKCPSGLPLAKSAQIGMFSDGNCPAVRLASPALRGLKGKAHPGCLWRNLHKSGCFQTGIARLFASRVPPEGVKKEKPFRVASGEICTNRDVFRRELLGCSPRESRPNVLKIKTKTSGFGFLFCSCDRSSKLGATVSK